MRRWLLGAGAMLLYTMGFFAPPVFASCTCSSTPSVVSTGATQSGCSVNFTFTASTSEGPQCLSLGGTYEYSGAMGTNPQNSPQGGVLDRGVEPDR